MAEEESKLGQPEKADSPEAKGSKPEEEGEIEEGEETASTSRSSDMELKELRESLK